MASIAKEHQDKLSRIKTNVKNSYEAFKHNYDRFNEFRTFIFETSLTQDDITLLTSIEKPAIEFNITEAYISRLMGEFSKQEPSISVGAEDPDKADPMLQHVIEQHMRHVMLDSDKHSTRWEIMKDLYSGGFSTAKVYTEYTTPMSFKQKFVFDRVYDPCLVGFDQLARRSHKGDGKFCFELYPYDIDTFKSIPEFKHVNTDRISFGRQFAGFNWSYLNGNEKIILVAEYYEKKMRNVKIVELADERIMTMAEYKAMEETWGEFTQMPAIRDERMTQLPTVVRYRCIEDQVLDYKETDFTFFPLVFFDGNSIMIKNPKTSGSVKQMTRPYVYHAKGAQRLKNFSGITLANEIENSVQHKFLVAAEALPKEQDWLAPYKNHQKPSNLVYNAFFEQDPDKPIPNPIREVSRIPAPPEVIQAFQSSDSLIQNILGSYDAALGINDNQLSGIAIVEAATQSNAAAMPYIVGFLQGLQRVAEIILDMIPKYYTTPRTLPVKGVDGKLAYVKVNQPDGLNLFYDPHVFNVKVEAGVSFAIQKSKALAQIEAMMQASPAFAQFMNERGLPVLLDNIEIRGIDQLKEMVEDWLKQQEQQKQMMMQAQQQAMQNNPQMMRNNIEMAKLNQKAQNDQAQAMLSQGQLALDYQKLKADQNKMLSDAIASKNNNITQLIKAETERFSKQVDLALKGKDMHHRHAKDTIEVAHKVSNPQSQVYVS